MITLDVIVNDPFDPERIKHLYADKEDLHLAWPKAKFPFCEKEWAAYFGQGPQNSSLLFNHQNETVGHIAFITKDEDLYLCFVILKSELRGQKLSRRMMIEAEEFCRLNYPHSELFLNVSKNNSPAKNLYISLGYQIYDETEEKFRMVKVLRP